MRFHLFLIVLASIGITACEPSVEPQEGSFTLLTYNVAGLPDELSGSNPAEYTSLISPLLNPYNLVLVQEDFAYHEDLSSQTSHPYQSTPAQPLERPVADGLNRFSTLPFVRVERTQWDSCFGVLDNSSDCLAEKGFSRAETTLADGVVVDIYNLHAEAGGGAEDENARADNFDQLAATIASASAGQAVIVAGDTNLHDEDSTDRGVLDAFLEATSLTEVCHALACGESHIDRVMVRDSADIGLTATQWSVAEEFVTTEGSPLSDHPAITVELSWSTGFE